MKIFLRLAAITILLGGGFLLIRPSTVVIKESGVMNGPGAGDSGVDVFTRDPVARPAPLPDPPTVVRAKYLSAWSAGSAKRVEDLLAGAERQHLNAVVIDIKDYSGYVSYAMDVAEVKEAGADRELRIADIDKLVARLHEKNIYVIARVSVFQDTVFAKAHPELALRNKTTGKLWGDRKGLAWLDPAGKDTWDYTVAIANDIFARGMDEVNFDYVRFPSDGDLENAAYPFWDGKTSRHEVMREFFAYLRGNLPGRIISADLFGLTAVQKDDMGIGQLIEDAYPYFDAVAPMVYPSHFGSGTLGYKNPAAYPYEIMSYALSHARARWDALSASSTGAMAKIRPWIQVFDLGAAYTPAMVKAELVATADTLATSTAYGGWMLWDPSNNYKSFNALY